MKTKTIVPLFAFIALLMACGPSKKKLQEQINEKEAVLFNENGILNPERGSEMINLYTEYFKKYPDDTLSAKYLFDAAGLKVTLKDYYGAINIYDTIINRFPSTHTAPQALFMKAFTYDNYLQRINEARQYYQQFIERYPNHSLTNDAKKSIEFLGKTDEEIMKMLEEASKNANPE
ncbi:MAG: tetratricopeptide repeat protein [Bacteroidales bacterium]|jgi:outer membrane protein assembly factor BamD (BamD/ComL family)|nr:tetratricopeptide repeat protein [Bacteroidales bacterium]NPV37063.1 tetratricopeptide repeat protein [Bacteroidales bacterium]